MVPLDRHTLLVTADKEIARRDPQEEPSEAEPADCTEAIDDLRTTSPESGTSVAVPRTRVGLAVWGDEESE